MMKVIFRLLLLVICLISVRESFAQTVSYTNRPLLGEVHQVQYSIAKMDSVYYLIVTVHSSKMYFLTNPIMKVRTFNDEVFTLNGVNVRDNSQTAAYISGTNGNSNTATYIPGRTVYPITRISTTAQFRITPEQLDKMGNGIAKIRLSMTPMNHERTFKKDKIGKKLYKLYQKVKDQDESF